MALDSESYSARIPVTGPSRLSRSERRRVRLRRRRRRIAALVVLVLLAPVAYSYTTTMLQPSSLPLGIRSVEWLRANGAAWLVNDAENLWYSWHSEDEGQDPRRAE
jgi:hypothetical protein